MHKIHDPDSLNLLLIHICRLHYRRAQELFDAIGVYRGQPQLLEALWEKDGLTHSALAARLRIKPATVSRMIQRMESAHFVVRKPDSHDLRVSRVYLTQEGRAIKPAIEQAIHTHEADTFAHFTVEERVLLRRLLMQMRDNLAGSIQAAPQEEEHFT
jgi:DNA-binding MarR family transcriptional regulator